MERTIAKKIMGQNFIGPEELKKISHKFGISDPPDFKKTIPEIPFDLNLLKRVSMTHILILGIPEDKEGKKLTINRMREIFGWNSEKSEPCFYNQDWYLKEKFAKDKTLDFKWYLIKKNVNEKTKGKSPENILKKLEKREAFPEAVLTAFTFFTYYFLTNGKILWKGDFIWCKDKDHNGDRIYTGRYIDPNKINKNGFNVHRFLSVRNCYALASQILCK